VHGLESPISGFIDEFADWSEVLSLQGV